MVRKISLMQREKRLGWHTGIGVAGPAADGGQGVVPGAGAECLCHAAHPPAQRAGHEAGPDAGAPRRFTDPQWLDAGAATPSACNTLLVLLLTEVL